MPKLRLFGATKIPLADEYMTLPATSISPELGFSSPAIERKVVVLPQPDGPSSVNSLPSGTSKLTSWAALTAVPRSPGYSVNSDLTLSTFVPVGCSIACSCFRYAEPLAYELGQHHQAEQQDDQHDAERGQLDILTILPQLPYHDRDHLGARAIEQNRARQLADRDDQHINPAREQSRLEQRQDDAAEGHAPGCPAHGGRLLELLVDLHHRGRGVAHAVRHEARHIGDQHDLDRAIDTDVDVK